MKKAVFICLLLLGWQCKSGAQTMKAGHGFAASESKSRLIANGRQLLLDKLIEGDRTEVRKLMDGLLSLEDSNYAPFNKVEKCLLSYWTGDYAAALRVIKSFDSMRNRRNYQILPRDETLRIKLEKILKRQRGDIRAAIRNSDLNRLDGDFLILNLDYLLSMEGYVYTTWYPPMSKEARDSINEAANVFLKAYPNSEYDYYIRHHIRVVYKPVKLGFGFEFFSGCGIFSGDLSRHFTNDIPIGLDFDISYKRFILYLRDYVGLNRTEDSLHFPEGTWYSGDAARVYVPEASIGYAVFDNGHVQLAPFAGIASTSISPTLADEKEKPAYKDIALKFTTTYCMGLNFDLRLGPSRTPIVAAKEQSYWFVRLRYALTMPQFDWHYSGYSGVHHLITVGFGAFGRRLKRDY
jgi:hypothetical protein